MIVRNSNVYVYLSLGTKPTLNGHHTQLPRGKWSSPFFWHDTFFLLFVNSRIKSILLLKHATEVCAKGCEKKIHLGTMWKFFVVFMYCMYVHKQCEQNEISIHNGWLFHIGRKLRFFDLNSWTFWCEFFCNIHVQNLKNIALVKISTQRLWIIKYYYVRNYVCAYYM